MISFFQYSFMIRALLAGTVIAVVAPVIGTFLLTKRYSLFSDTLSHVALAGVAIGLFFGVSPLAAAVVVTVLAAVFLEKLRKDRKIPGEAALALFLSGGLALAVTLISASKNLNVNILNYLFGSIATVQPLDVLLISGLSVVVFGVIVCCYKELMFVSIDEDAATVSGLPVQKLNVLLIVLTAITVTVAMQIVGVLLVGALMVIPVLTATQVARSFKQIFFYGIFFSLSAVIVGLTLSYFFDLAAGGVIVLIALALFGLVMVFKKQ